MASPNEGSIYVIDNTLTSSNGEVNGALRIQDAAGYALPSLLPTTAGDYTLRVAGTAPNLTFTWVLEGT